LRRKLMRRTILFLALVLVTTSSFAANRRGRWTDVFVDDDLSSPSDCSAMTVRFDGQRAAVVSDDVPLGNLRSLKVRGAQNGGVRVFGGASRYGVTVCKAVANGDSSAVRATMNGNELQITGPADDSWTAYVLISAPRGAELEVSTTNGPIAVESLDGRLNARALNGPISVEDSTGDLDIETTNGPISLTGGSGNVKLDAQNGPLTVNLSGSSWNGSLDARTQNGPLNVRLPRGYRSGVIVQTSGRSPVNCRAEGCDDRARGRYDDDDDRARRFELGSGHQNVHLSTVNGPLSVRDTN
jgi:hypothetical protein